MTSDPTYWRFCLLSLTQPNNRMKRPGRGHMLAYWAGTTSRLMAHSCERAAALPLMRGRYAAPMTVLPQSLHPRRHPA